MRRTSVVKMCWFYDINFDWSRAVTVSLFITEPTHFHYWHLNGVNNVNTSVQQVICSKILRNFRREKIIQHRSFLKLKIDNYLIYLKMKRSPLSDICFLSCVQVPPPVKVPVEADCLIVPPIATPLGHSVQPLLSGYRETDAHMRLIDLPGPLKWSVVMLA